MMKYAIVTVPAAAVRKKASHRAEMSNQLLFGEAVKVLKIKKEKWLQVESLYDGYKGWLTYHLVTAVAKELAFTTVPLLAGGLLNTIESGKGIMHIPRGSFLVGLQQEAGGFEGFIYNFKGAVINTNSKTDKRELVEKYALEYLNAPYLWGGKTILGIDCSGFSQTVFKLVGVPLRRDAWQQAQQGREVKKLTQATTGDLAFFDDKEEIVHVGILLGPDTIIHSAGKVRIDTIDEKGIINVDTGKRTHRLKMIKRLL